MKALSRKRRKGGRPKKADVDRTPSGQISRAEDAQVMTNLEMEAATWKRRKIFPDLTPEEARKQEHGSVIARWLLESQIARKRRPELPHPNAFTQLHYDTAQRFDMLHKRWLAAIGAKQMRSSSEFGQVGGHPGDPFMQEVATREAKVIAEFKAARHAILQCGTPLGMMAIESIVLENQPSDNLRGDLRQALNSLSVLWRMQSAA